MAAANSWFHNRQMDFHAAGPENERPAFFIFARRKPAEQPSYLRHGIAAEMEFSFHDAEFGLGIMPDVPAAFAEIIKRFEGKMMNVRRVFPRFQSGKMRRLDVNQRAVSSDA